MNRAIRCSLLVLFLLMSVHSAKASEVRAFHNINQLPFKQVFGLPSLDNSPLTEAGAMRFNVITNISNTYDISVGTDDTLETDI
ncbi:hypothetical protein ACFLYW_02590, partial [Thermodesulfobacteriota bacterium]